VSQPTSSTTIIQEAFATFAVGLGIGPCYAVGRIWASEQLIYNILRDGEASVDGDGVFHGTAFLGGKKFTFEMFPGTVDQPPSDLIEQDLGTINTPRYPRLCYIVFKDFPLASFGNTLQGSSLKFELIKLPQIYTPGAGE